MLVVETAHTQCNIDDKFPIPITINPYENFTIQMTSDNSPPISQTMDIYMMLHAYMRRPT